MTTTHRRPQVRLRVESVRQLRPVSAHLEGSAAFLSWATAVYAC